VCLCMLCLFLFCIAACFKYFFELLRSVNRAFFSELRQLSVCYVFTDCVLLVADGS